jgi:hypothetical protein
MGEESSAAADAQRKAAGQELLRKLAASRAERARLREQVYEALRQLERISQRGRR